jgi:hypothetical protein
VILGQIMKGRTLRDCLTYPFGLDIESRWNLREGSLSNRIAILVGVICLATTSLARAELVGDARTVKNEVTGKLGPQVRQISVGDTLSGNEVVSTGTESATLVHFIDDSTLTIGPASSVVLDRFVVNPNKSTKDAVISMTTGTLRFITGRSDPKNFTIKTKTFTLGIRGTDGTVHCVTAGTVVTCAIWVNSGHFRVCPQDTTNQPNVDFSRRNVACKGGFELDANGKNFFLRGTDGTTDGPKTVPADVLAAQNVAAANGDPVNFPTDSVTGAINNPGGDFTPPPVPPTGNAGIASGSGGGNCVTIISCTALLSASPHAPLPAGTCCQ